MAELIADGVVVDAAAGEVRVAEEGLARHQWLAVRVERDACVVWLLLVNVGSVDQQFGRGGRLPQQARRRCDPPELAVVAERAAVGVGAVGAVHPRLFFVNAAGRIPRGWADSLAGVRL